MVASKLTPEERLRRKRNAARIRQQRCRARKRQALLDKQRAEKQHEEEHQQRRSTNNQDQQIRHAGVTTAVTTPTMERRNPITLVSSYEQSPPPHSSGYWSAAHHHHAYEQQHYERSEARYDRSIYRRHSFQHAHRPYPHGYQILQETGYETEYLDQYHHQHQHHHLHQQENGPFRASPQQSYAPPPPPPPVLPLAQYPSSQIRHAHEPYAPPRRILRDEYGYMETTTTSTRARLHPRRPIASTPRRYHEHPPPPPPHPEEEAYYSNSERTASNSTPLLMSEPRTRPPIRNTTNVVEQVNRSKEAAAVDAILSLKRAGDGPPEAVLPPPRIKRLVPRDRSAFQEVPQYSRNGNFQPSENMEPGFYVTMRIH